MSQTEMAHYSGKMSKTIQSTSALADSGSCGERKHNKVLYLLQLGDPVKMCEIFYH
ncbi:MULTISPECIES: hypothetical protein [Acetobacter]|uniref:hypothetical protein n=1 Tax=Acetobacter TaxID=434 RepID=UPI0012D7FC2A|nr:MULTISPECIES: hypothetical protein [Acetobacter]MCP1202363.1 hypothetical protein [Acetobacter oryzoeni]